MVSNELLNDIRMGMNLVEGDEYKDILEGITKITCDIVTKTLGPYASTTVIDDGASTYSTKDGWSVVNRIRFGDVIENTLFKFIKDISFSLNSKVGDGTTTAIVAANMFIVEFRKWIDAQRSSDSKFKYIRQADLLKGIETAAGLIIDELKSEDRIFRVKKPEDIYKIANISTNGNEEISRMIADIYKKTENPSIHVTLNIGGETYSEIEEGYRIDSTLLNPNCHYNTSESTCVLNEGAKVVIFNHNVTYVDHYEIIQMLLTEVNQSKKSTLVVMAPFFDDTFAAAASASIRKIVNAGNISPFILVQIPYSTNLQKCFANDLAILLETEVFDYTKVQMFNQMQRALKGESSEFDEYAKLMEISEFKTPEEILRCAIGNARKLTIGKNFTLLQNFKKDTQMYKNTYEMLKENFDEAKAKADATNNRITMGYAETHQRLVKFMGNTGTIHIGGDSELSCKCLKDAVDDAVLACQSAYENGYIRGMNIETMSAIDKLIKDDTIDKSELILECLRMFGRVFFNVSVEIMLNKYKNDGYTVESFGKLPWGLEYKGPNASNTKACNKKIKNSDSYKKATTSAASYPTEIINICIDYGYEYNLVTETFGPAGYSVVNSVATDIEVIRATTSILSLLLSSSQLVSINKGFDKKLSKKEAMKNERMRYNNITTGIVEAIKDSDLYIPGFTAGYCTPTTLETTNEE